MTKKIETIESFRVELAKIAEKYRDCAIDPLVIQSLTSEVHNLYRLHYEIMNKPVDFYIGDIHIHKDGSVTIDVHRKKPYISFDTSFKFVYK